MSTRPQVFITDFWTWPPDVEQAALADTADVAVLGAHHEDELLPHLPRADGLLVWHDIRLSARAIHAATQCRIITRIGVGFDNVDRAAARDRGIVVCNVPDYGTEDVADHALMLLLALAKNLPQFTADLRAAPPRWNARRNERMPRLRGMVLGVIGLGRIGTATAMRARAFGLDVVYFDPYLADGMDKALGVRRADSLEQLLRQADVISLHVPLTDETRGMINAATLARGKPGQFLINTARGPVCDTTAVLAALERGQLAGVGLDVLPIEPPPAEDPLLRAFRDPRHPRHHRILVTPHAAFYTEEGFVEMRRKAAEEVRRALRGEPVRNRVN